ncbi:MAG: aldehyde dehydrogenase family protein [Chitinophagaceae bacterium]|nr:aldehyde dehydrogenase family protein [Chitinophagaceae bacterium]
MKCTVRNPRTGEYDYSFEKPDRKQLQEITKRLRNGFQNWKQKDVAFRVQVLKAWQENIHSHFDRIVEFLVSDTGRYEESRLEAELVIKNIDRWCSSADDILRVPPPGHSSIPFISLQQEYVPYGLVGVISPWNFPLLLSLIDTIPALLAGCAVLIKPSEVTPRFIEVMNQTIQQTDFLKEVLTYIPGDGETGSFMIDLCDLICFTGSTQTGQKVYAAAAAQMKPVFLELGGKDPAIILEDAHLEEAARAILWGSCVNNGHSCLSIERVFVHQNVLPGFLKLLKHEAQKITLAISDPQSGHLGPIIFEKQAAVINRHLEDARLKGAVLEFGEWECRIINGAYYLPPTILTSVNREMLIMQEETFGPVIPIMSFSDLEDAIEWANDSPYGLSGAVFSGNQENAMRVARRLEVGAVSINDAALTAVIHEGEKNSFKLSGIGGSRMGPASVKRFLRKKLYLIKDQQVSSPWWW